MNQMKVLLKGANRSNYPGANISNEKVSSSMNGPKLKGTQQSTKPFALRTLFSSLTHFCDVNLLFVLTSQGSQ